MEVYHPVLKRIVLVTLKLYVFLADRPGRTDILSSFFVVGELWRVFGRVIFLKW